MKRNFLLVLLVLSVMALTLAGCGDAQVGHRGQSHRHVLRALGRHAGDHRQRRPDRRR